MPAFRIDNLMRSRYKLVKDLVPPTGNVQVKVRQAAADPSASILPVSLDVVTTKRSYTLQVLDIRRFVEDNLQDVQNKLDCLGIPTFSLHEIEDNMEGPGAGLALCNERLFPFDAQERWIRVCDTRTCIFI
jgi:hypothetical protein